MSDTPQNLTALQEQIELARASRDLAALRLEGAALAESMSSVGFGWSTGWGDLVDPFFNRRDDFGQMWLPLGSGTLFGRQDGRNRPFAWTDFDLDRTRSLARWLATKNDLAKGIIRSLTNFTVKKGYEWEPRPIRGQEQNTEAVKLARECRHVIEVSDRISRAPSRERSSCRRSIRDGEAITRHFAQPDGYTLTRFVEPEQLREPAGCDSNCAFGVETDPHDVETVWFYHITYDGTAYERVPADEVCHLKRNVDECVKRGLSDFYSSGEALDGVHKLLRNMREAGAVQAAIAWIEQFESSSAAQVSAGAIAGVRDLNRPQVQHPVSGRDLSYQKFEPGTIVRVGKGKEYIGAPLAGNTTQHTSIVQACLRALGCSWNMPEHMVSGDASNNNYASILVAGSPFVNGIECEQDDYGEFFRQWRWIAIRNACHAGLISAPFETVQQLVELHYTAPQVAVADQAKEADIDHKDMAIGALSLQTRRARRGLDTMQERHNLKEEPLTRALGKATDLDSQGNPVKGQPGQSQDKKQTPAQDEPDVPGGAEGLRASVGGSQAIASLQQSVYDGKLPREAAIANAVLVFGFAQGDAEKLFPEVKPQKTADDGQQPQGALGSGGTPGLPGLLGESLRESGFTGTLKDSLGRERHYVDGKQVAGHEDAPPERPQDRQARQQRDQAVARENEIHGPWQGKAKFTFTRPDDGSFAERFHDPFAVRTEARVKHITDSLRPKSLPVDTVYDRKNGWVSLMGQTRTGEASYALAMRLNSDGAMDVDEAVTGGASRAARIYPDDPEELVSAKVRYVLRQKGYKPADRKRVWDRQGRLTESLLVEWLAEAAGLDTLLLEHAVGEPFQGPSGRWFVVKDLGSGKTRVVPAANPNKQAKAKAQDGGKTDAAGKARPAKLTLDQAHALIERHLAAGQVDAAAARELAGAWMSLTTAELGKLKQRLGLKASGAKSELARKLAERALAAAKAAADSTEREQAHGALKTILGELKGLNLEDPEAVKAALRKALGGEQPAKEPTPREEPEAPKTATKPAEQPKPEAPASQPTEKPAAPERHPVVTKHLETVSRVLRAASHLDDEQKRHFGNAYARPLKRMTPAALERFDRGLDRDPTFLGDTDSLKQYLIENVSKPESKAKIASAQQIGGAYFRSRLGGEAYTNGLVLDGDKVRSSDTSPYMEDTAQSIYAHEMAHAIDGPGHELSNSQEWKAAYEAEIKPGGLTRYAKQDPSEAFAEFGRLILGGTFPAAQVKRDFPGAFAFWSKRGLANDVAPAPSGERTALPEVFSKKTDLGEAGHTDELLDLKRPK